MKKRAVFLFIAAMIFTSLAAYGQQTYILPQVANGLAGGLIFRTTFIFFNTTGASATVQITLTNDEGAPMVVTIPGLGTNSQFTVTLTQGDTRILQTDGSGAII